MTVTENIQHLIIEVEAEVEHFHQLLDDVARSVTRFSELDQLNIHDIRGNAMLLTEIYMGAENLMLRVAKSLAEPIPSGKAWHKELLTQLASENLKIRPPLFSLVTAEQLDEFRRFRHVVHHVYSIDYDWNRIKVLLTDAESLLTNLINDAENFKAFLSSTIIDDGG